MNPINIVTMFAIDVNYINNICSVNSNGKKDDKAGNNLLIKTLYYLLFQIILSRLKILLDTTRNIFNICLEFLMECIKPMPDVQIHYPISFSKIDQT